MANTKKSSTKKSTPKSKVSSRTNTKARVSASTHTSAPAEVKSKSRWVLITMVAVMVIMLVTTLVCSLFIQPGSESPRLPFIEEDKTFSFRLYDNSSTGYSWSYEIDHSDVISATRESDYSKCPDDVHGCGGEAVFTVEGLKPGQAQMSLKYCFVDEDKLPCETAVYDFTVDDDLNITETHSGSVYDDK